LLTIAGHNRIVKSISLKKCLVSNLDKRDEVWGHSGLTREKKTRRVCVFFPTSMREKRCITLQILSCLLPIAGKPTEEGQ